MQPFHPISMYYTHCTMLAQNKQKIRGQTCEATHAKQEFQLTDSGLLVGLVENGAPLHPAGQRSMIRAVLDVGTIRLQLGILLHDLVNGSLELGETPLLGHVDLIIHKNKTKCHG